MNWNWYAWNRTNDQLNFKETAEYQSMARKLGWGLNLYAGNGRRISSLGADGRRRYVYERDAIVERVGLRSW